MQAFYNIGKKNFNRNRFFYNILEKILDKNLSVLCIKRKTLFEEKKNLFLNKSGYLGYLYNNQDEKDFIIADIQKERNWHKPNFYYLIARSNVFAIYKERVLSSSDGFKAIEEELESQIDGFVEPIDDELQFYGNNFFKEIILSVAEREK